MTLAIVERQGRLTFAVKVVPGSRQDRIAGCYGDALKVAVAAPAEQGKANRRLCAVLAAALTVPARAVTVIAGHGGAHKQVAVDGLTAAELRARLQL